MPGCGKKCGKQKKRQSKVSRKSEDKYAATEYASGVEVATDLDSILTDATEYQTISGRSTGTARTKGRRTPGRKRDQRPQREASARKKPQKSPERFPNDDYSSERSYPSTPSGKIPGKKRRTRPSSETEEDISEMTKSSSKCATVNLSKFLGEESTETESCEDDEDGIGCEDETCGGGRIGVKTKRKRPPSESESSDEETASSSEKCPELCEHDPTKLPEEKPKKCDSNCRRQKWLERQREKKQAEMDDYLLRKGFRYFDDMCKCSLKCILSQMYVDPFMRNVAFSTVGFFLGIKLCWELDGFYIIF
ncbi:muscle M-line assembly protein unc-89-like [Diachasma alloeum]|uniref:muscle M-line assembly protein unc-89-like n=1 Tax=Diachasma alloeum TaxID=454923 RepID=UPI000738115C|nr:muscle M-line assembly protein unc-89-like [Diachasma alloeum]